MRLKLPIFFLILFCLCACDGIQNSKKDVSKTATTAPSTVLDSATINKVFAVRDIGRLKHGEVVSIKFAIENGHEKPLIVTNIKSTCGCVSVNYKPTPLKNGEKMELELTYDSLNRFGTQFANVMINTNFGEYIYRIEVFVDNG